MKQAATSPIQSSVQPLIQSFNHFLLRYSTFNIRFPSTPAPFRPLAISLLLALSLSLPAQQQWTEPVKISNISMYQKNHADMMIDHSGVIHVVWSMEVGSFHWKIMYSFSEDDGNTWTEPLDLLKNTDLWMSQPHIACDSNNNLYVTYDYATGTPSKMVYMIVYDGEQWGEPIVVSEGLPGSDYNKILVDIEGRVFVFWGYQEVNIKYRIYYKNSFGEILEPYYNALPDAYYVYYNAIDTNNHIHWVGYTTEGMLSGTFAHAYFLFDPMINEWDAPQNISIVKAQIGNGIDLLHNLNPVVVIREDNTQLPPPYNDITFVMENDGVNWLYPEIVANTKGLQKYQQIVVDQNNDIQIIEGDKTNTNDYLMVHYKKIIDSWVGFIIDSTSVPFKALFVNNKIYLIYYKYYIRSKDDNDVFFAKCEIITEINEEPNPSPELKIYPNPARENMYIEFENNKQQHIDLSIYDMTGKYIVTLISETKPPGKYRQLWKVTDKYRKENTPHLYLVRLQSGRKTVTRTVEIIR